MNKIYKVIWSKTRNCYVVASELAKRHTKSPTAGGMNRAVVAGVLACVLSCGVVTPAYAVDYHPLSTAEAAALYSQYLSGSYKSNYDLIILTSSGASSASQGSPTDTIIPYKITSSGTLQDINGNSVSNFANGQTILATYIVPKGASYTLPAATSSVLGGVKIGSNITNSSGTISLTKANVTSALGYTPPTADTNTHYTTHLYAGSGTAANAATTNGNTKIALADDSTVRNTLTIKGAGKTTVTSDANGVITITSTDANTTYSAMKGATASAAGTAGLVPAPAAGKQTAFLRGDGTWVVPTDTNTHYTTHLYAGSGTAANAATTNGNTKIALTDDSTVRNTLTIKGTGATTVTSDANGVITINSTDNNTTYSAATQSANGLMTAADKKKLDGIASGANAYTLPAATSSALGGVKIGSNITNSDGTISLTKANVTAALGYTPPTTDTNTTYDNMSATELSTGTATTARSISAKTIADYVTGKVSAETTARTSAVSSEATTRANADTALGTRIDGTIKDLSVSGRTITYTKGDGTTGTITTQDSNTTYDAMSASELSTGTATTSRTMTAKVVSDYVKGKTDDKLTGLSVSGKTITYTKGDGTTGTITTQDTTYGTGTADNLTTGTDTTGKVWTSKILADYVKGQVATETTNRTTAITNEASARSDADTALSNRIGSLTADGNYIKKSATNNVSANLTALDTQLKTTTNAVSTETTNRTSADTALSNRIGTVSADGNYIKASTSKNIAENVGLLDTAVKANATSIANEVTNRTVAVTNEATARSNADIALGTRIDNAVSAYESADTGLSNRIGSLTADGNYIKKSDTKNISENLGLLDTQLKTTTTAVSTEATTRANADTALGTRIDGTIKGLSVNGRTITYTKGDGSTGTITTQDTTYTAGNGLSLNNGTFSVNTNGVVESGNTGIVTGDTVYNALETRIGQINVENNAQNTVAVGDGSTVGGDGAVAVGTGSSGSGEGSVAVGGNTSADGTGSVAVGDTSTSDGEGSVAVGTGSTSSGEGSVAVGGGTSTSSDNSVVVGTGSTVTGTDSENSVAIGGQTNVTGSDSVALGGGSSVNSSESTALGGNTVVNNDNSVALGYGSNASQDNVVSVGHTATDTDADGTAYGSDLTRRIVNVANGTSASDAATVGQTYVMQNGSNTTVTEAGTNAIGQKIYQMTVNTDGQVTSGNTGIVTGGTVYDALEARIGAITVENNAQNTVAVGDNSSVSGDGAVAVGTGSSSSGEGSVAVGDTSSSTGQGSVAVGGTSSSAGEGSVAVGDTSNSSGDGSVAVGSNSKAESDNTVVIGTGSTVTGTDSDNSVAIGQQTNVTGSDSVALGGGSSVTGTDSTALGGNTVVNNDNSVALGSGSNASQDNVVSVGHSATDTDATGTAYGSDLTRRIVNVADGSSASDAATVGQTYVLQNGTNTTVTENGTNSIGQKIYTMTVNTDGQVVSGNAGIVTGGTVYDALEARIGAITVENNAQNTVAVGDGSSVSGDGAIAVGTGSAGSGEGSVAVGNTSTSTGEGSVAVGSNTTAESDNTVVIGAGSIVSGTDSGNSVAIGQQTSVTGSDSIALGGGSSITGTESTAVGGNTVVNNDNSVALGFDSNASDDNVVSVGHKASDKDSANQEYGTDLFRRIINVADAVNEHDAVTKGQLDSLMTDRIGSLASNGNYVLKDNTMSANLLALDTQLKTVDISTIKYDGTDRALATLGGTNGTKLTNLKAATLNASSTDAVTGAQLYATNQNIAGFATDINRNKTNIATLNTSVTAALGTVSSTSTLVNTLNDLKADASLNNLTVAGRNVIATAAANAVQEYMAEQNGNSNTNVTPPAAPLAMRSFAKPMLASAGGADTNYVVYDDASANTVTLEGTIGTGTKVTNVADAELSASSMDAVNGHQLYEVTQQFDEFQSALSQNNTSIARAQTDINNIKNANIVLQSDVNTLKTQMDEGFNVTVDGALVKKVNPDSNYVNFEIGDNISIENNNGTVKFSVNANGQIVSGNTAPVSGGTVYDETRVASDGNYVVKDNTIAENVSALDVALKQVNDLAQQAAEVGTDANAVHYDGTDKSKVTLAGVNGTTITNLKDGILSADSKDAVTGGQLFATNTRVGTLEQNYSDLQNTVNNSVDKDLSNLSDTGKEVIRETMAGDLAGKANTDLDNITDAGKQVIRDTMAQDIAGRADTNLSNLTEAGLDVIRNAVSSDLNSKMDTNMNNITDAGKEVVREIVANDLNQKANKDASNIETEKWLEKLGQGKVQEGNTSLINGDTLFKETRPNTDGTYVKKDKAIGDNLLSLDTTISELSTAIGNATVHSVSVNSVDPDTDTNYDSKGATGDDALAVGVSASAKGNEAIALGHNAQANGEQSIAIGTGNVVNGSHSGTFGDPNTVNGDNSYVVGNNNTVDGNNTFVFSNNANVMGNNSVILGAGSDGTQDNVVSVGAKGNERKIVYVADGEISASSTDAVNGSQLYTVQKNLQNADGINVDKWSEKLGTGVVEEGNTGLVTGGTIFKVMENYQGTDLIKLDTDANAIRIGGLEKYNDVGTVDFRTADGSSRVITGVATNPKDPSSVANVGYVNEINNLLINGVNQGFEKMDTRINKVGANAAALASLTPASFEGDEKWSLAASVGNFHGETAGAVGAFYKPTENVMMNIRSSFGNNENMLGAGVSVSLSKGDVPGVTKRQLAREVVTLKQNQQKDQLLISNILQAREQDQQLISEQGKQINEQNKQITELKAMVQKMAEQMNVGK